METKLRYCHGVALFALWICLGVGLGATMIAEDGGYSGWQCYLTAFIFFAGLPVIGVVQVLKDSKWLSNLRLVSEILCGLLAAGIVVSSLSDLSSWPNRLAYAAGLAFFAIIMLPAVAPIVETAFGTNALGAKK